MSLNLFWASRSTVIIIQLNEEKSSNEKYMLSNLAQYTIKQMDNRPKICTIKNALCPQKIYKSDVVLWLKCGKQKTKLQTPAFISVKWVGMKQQMTEKVFCQPTNKRFSRINISCILKSPCCCPSTFTSWLHHTCVMFVSPQEWILHFVIWSLKQRINLYLSWVRGQ